MENRYFPRNIDPIPLSWSREAPPDRKPLLLHGARQVRKSSAVRQLGGHFRYFVEINFDEDREAGRFFDTALFP
jgi:predicted AAA+ superfamily ATPase